jgi:hypothetical protein
VRQSNWATRSDGVDGRFGRIYPCNSSKEQYRCWGRE